MAARPAMAHMLRTPQPVEPAPVTAAGEPEPHYPYGLRMSLDLEDCEACNLDTEGVSVGHLLDMRIFATVTSASVDPTTGKLQRVELQVTHMQCEDENEEEPEGSVLDKLYE